MMSVTARSGFAPVLSLSTRDATNVTVSRSTADLRQSNNHAL